MPYRFGHDPEISAFVTGGTPTRQEAKRALARARRLLEETLDPADVPGVWQDLAPGVHPQTIQSRLARLFAPAPVPFVRSFYQHSRSYYRDSSPLSPGMTDNIMVSVRGTGDDGLAVSGEFGIDWVDLGGGPSARIEAFHDSIAAMNCCGDFLYALEKACEGRKDSPTPDEVRDILEGLGYGDVTSSAPELGPDDARDGPAAIAGPHGFA